MGPSLIENRLRSLRKDTTFLSTMYQVLEYNGKKKLYIRKKIS
jgi:hypothetical protein